jgi:hypothetical protein
MKIERQLQGVFATIIAEQIKAQKLENKITPFTIQEENRADILLQSIKSGFIFFCTFRLISAVRQAH